MVISRFSRILGISNQEYSQNIPLWGNWMLVALVVISANYWAFVGDFCLMSQTGFHPVTMSQVTGFD